MVASEAHIKLTVRELEEAVFGFTQRERRDDANFFIDALKRSSDLFDTYPGMVSDTAAELWITDQDLECRHHISVSSDKKGLVKYQKVSMKGEVERELIDLRADKVIKEVLVKVGALIIIED